MNLLKNTICKLLLLLFSFAPPLASAEDDQFKVAILMFDQVQIIDFAAPYEVFGQAGFDVFTVSKEGKPVTAVMGLDVIPDYSFSNMPKADAILVPGGNVHDAMQDKAIRRWLLQHSKQVPHILSVCTGSHILAEAGLLDGEAATTFHGQFNSFAKNYPEILLITDQRFVDNGQVITSAGLSSGMDAALHFVSKVRGLDKAKSVAMHIEYDWSPEKGFVRGDMADKFWPDPQYAWPEDVQFSNGVSFGDRRNWQKSYRVTTRASQEALLLAFKDAMDKHNGWSHVANASGEGLRYQTNNNGSIWVLDVVVQSLASPNNFKLMGKLAKQG